MTLVVDSIAEEGTEGELLRRRLVHGGSVPGARAEGSGRREDGKGSRTISASHPIRHLVDQLLKQIGPSRLNREPVQTQDVERAVEWARRVDSQRVPSKAHWDARLMGKGRALPEVSSRPSCGRSSTDRAWTPAAGVQLSATVDPAPSGDVFGTILLP